MTVNESRILLLYMCMQGFTKRWEWEALSVCIFCVLLDLFCLSLWIRITIEFLFDDVEDYVLVPR